MDVSRLSSSGRVLWILVLTGLWDISLHRSSNPDGSQRTVKSIEEKASSCSLSSCQHGYCPFRSCSCDAGFTGVTCQDVPSSCFNDLECNKGVCSGGKCVCKQGYTGPDCKEETTTCYMNSCLHGFCPSQECVCYDGYTGPDCDVASCKSSTCIHGSCTSDGTCKCDNGFQGLTCNEASSTCNYGWIVGVSVGVPLGIMLFICMCYCCWKCQDSDSL